MTTDINAISTAARKAAQKLDWQTVGAQARQILAIDDSNAEGHFLFGLSEKAQQRPAVAIQAFTRAIELDDNRYDAAIELAHQFAVNRDCKGARAMVEKYEQHLGNSPRYLDLAGTVYSNINLWEQAWPLYQKANELQPNSEIFQSNVAHCASTIGKFTEAKEIYLELLQKRPMHQRNHYNLSRLERAKDYEHVNQMKRVLANNKLPPERNIFIYYALGKELEDLEQWDESFEYYKKGGDAVASVSTYKIESDLDVIDMAKEVCTATWLERGIRDGFDHRGKTPIFVVGLPRTGTTLTERILSSHSAVESAGETQFVEIGIRVLSQVQSRDLINAEMLSAFRNKGVEELADFYLDAVDYLLSDKPYFVEKLPYNFMYAGFIARAFPDAPIIHLRRHPMDACFAMYKQVFTWAYRCSYTLRDLGQYYVAYHRLMEHWREVLGDRLLEVDYESLVSDQEAQTHRLLDFVGLPFEDACLNFHANKAPTATASSIQVREKVHTRSVNRWQRFAEQLAPLKAHLEANGIEVP